MALDPTAAKSDGLAKTSIPLRGQATESNGFNCTLGSSGFANPCTTVKAGATRISRDVIDETTGQPATLYSERDRLGEAVARREGRPEPPGRPRRARRRARRGPIRAVGDVVRRRAQPTRPRSPSSCTPSTPSTTSRRPRSAVLGRAARADARQRRGDRDARRLGAGRAGAAALPAFVLERRARRLPRGALRGPATCAARASGGR